MDFQMGDHVNGFTCRFQWTFLGSVDFSGAFSVDDLDRKQTDFFFFMSTEEHLLALSHPIFIIRNNKMM